MLYVYVYRETEKLDINMPRIAVINGLLGFCSLLALGCMSIEQTTYFATGVVFYLVGLYFYMRDNVSPWYHAIWHCFTLLAAYIHFVGLQ